MDFFSILFISVGLAMDAFAVSIASGIAIRELKIKHALIIAVFFGTFQAIMPLLGWLAGLGLKEYISNISHWVAFGLLTFIGCKMIYESFKMESIEKGSDPMNLHMLLLLSVATSIDALAVGTSFSFLGIQIITPAIIIGFVTFTMSFLGVIISNRFGHFFENKIEVVGGLILIGIGIKILAESLI